jgi:hypothetical protein
MQSKKAKKAWPKMSKHFEPSMEKAVKALQ